MEIRTVSITICGHACLFDSRRMGLSLLWGYSAYAVGPPLGGPRAMPCHAGRAVGEVLRVAGRMGGISAGTWHCRAVGEALRVAGRTGGISAGTCIVLRSVHLLSPPLASSKCLVTVRHRLAPRLSTLVDTTSSTPRRSRSSSSRSRSSAPSSLRTSSSCRCSRTPSPVTPWSRPSAP